MSILINKIGFKEEIHYVDPRITVSVVCKLVKLLGNYLFPNKIVYLKLVVAFWMVLKM